METSVKLMLPTVDKIADVKGAPSLSKKAWPSACCRFMQGLVFWDLGDLYC